MLTPQEVSEHAFAKASFGGYNMAMVDEFLDVLTADYTTLYKENATLKAKMKVLVDKVEEYRSTEEAMRKALMTAQRMADDLVQEAEQKKAELLKTAEAEVAGRKDAIAKELQAEEYRLQQAQQTTAAFVQRVRALQAEEEEFLENLSQLYPPETAVPQPDPVDETVSEIDDNVQRLLAQAMRDAAAENQRAKEASQENLDDTAEFAPVDQQEDRPKEDVDEDEERTSRIDFGELQFGRDYEIK